jgi:galactoside O-acetyltransferase
MYGREHIRFGRHVRIDAFTVLTASPDGMEIGDFVHIGAHCVVLGSAARVTFGRGAGLSPRVTLFTATDDFTSGVLVGPCIPSDLRGVRSGAVALADHAVVGCGSVILPGVTLGRGSAVGAMSLVRRDVEALAVVTNQRVVGHRDRDLLDRLDAELLRRCG